MANNNREGEASLKRMIENGDLTVKLEHGEVIAIALLPIGDLEVRYQLETVEEARRRNVDLDLDEEDENASGENAYFTGRVLMENDMYYSRELHPDVLLALNAYAQNLLNQGE